MKKSVKTTMICLFAILVTVISGLVGYFIGKNSNNAVSSKDSDTDGCNYYTFYASISEISNDMFLVDGLDINDINYRGNFEFSVDDTTRIIWRGTEIDSSDLRVGDLIAITYSGAILETDPARFVQPIKKIDFLGDELPSMK